MQMNQVKKICLICQKEFSVIFSRRDKAKFCSKKCMGKGEHFQNMGKRMRPLFKGKPKDIEWKEKASIAKLGSRNPMWKGDQAGNDALHIWVSKRLSKPEKCQECGLVPPYDLANISPTPNPETYTRELKYW